MTTVQERHHRPVDPRDGRHGGGHQHRGDVGRGRPQDTVQLESFRGEITMLLINFPLVVAYFPQNKPVPLS